MKPDLVFVVCGVVSLLAALYIVHTSRPRRVVPAALWALLGAGLLVQGFAPHLQIEHSAFRLPSDYLSQRATVDPATLVTRQRVLQALSALLTLLASAGLAYHYRRMFLRTGSEKPVVASAGRH